MKAEIIAVGSELLRLGCEESNGDWLLARLEEVGIDVAQRSRVGDESVRIASIVSSALQRSQVVAVTGGLGPTDDDRTREGLATALDEPLECDPDRLGALERRLRAHGVKMSAGQARQAERPRGALWIDNPLGSACGLLLLREERLLFALPGVPAEMKAMFRASVLPRLAERSRSLSMNSMLNTYFISVSAMGRVRTVGVVRIHPADGGTIHEPGREGERQEFSVALVATQARGETAGSGRALHRGRLS